MATRTTSHLEMITTHLNVPYGDVVAVADVALALSAGSLAGIQSGLSRALLMTMFIECAPYSILSAALEAGGSWRTVRSLYQETVMAGMQSVRDWETAA
ncbi:MAG TPA: hypothetical protein VKY31_10020 [Terriglobia bacterium]|nr:hypothetical protein [Terriglobia bacterium]